VLPDFFEFLVRKSEFPLPQLFWITVQIPFIEVIAPVIFDEHLAVSKKKPDLFKISILRVITPFRFFH